ncbi:unnamed protein product [Scytosiphon promiscuus]
MKVVLTGLQAVAAGAEAGGDGAAASKSAALFVPQRPSLFAASAMASLGLCRTLRVPHPQMAVVIEALFRGGHGAEVQMGCVSLALKLADKEQAYSTWLCGLFQRPLFVNLPLDVRRHLISVVDRLFIALPAEIATKLMEGVWSTITSSLFAHWSSGVRSGRDGTSLPDSEGITQAEAFLSRAGALVAAGAGSQVESITLAGFLPSILEAFCDRGDLTCLDTDTDEAPLWDALVGLLSRLPWKHVKGTIASKSDGATSRATSAVVCDRTFRQYLTSRLALAGEAEVTQAPGTSARQPSSLPAAAAATAAGKVLGSVARWAIRTSTDREASAAVLPRIAEGVKGIEATAAAGKWLLSLLDAAELPESCVLRALALVGGAATNWEPSGKGLLVTGDRTDKLFGRGMYGDDFGLAFWYSMSVTAPRAVLRLDRASPDVSTEVIARLLKVAGLLQGRVHGAATADDSAVAELKDARCGVEGFIRGLRHAPAVMDGALSRPFASYAESVATFNAEAQ